jgi:hypothetical protein
VNRDALIEKLLKLDNVEVKICADFVIYDIKESDVSQDGEVIFIEPDMY